MTHKTIYIIFISLLIVGCSRTLYMPAATDAKVQRELLSGRQLYVDRCSSCHNLHLPKEYDKAGWQQQLNQMQTKAKLSDEEKELILNYLISQP